MGINKIFSTENLTLIAIFVGILVGLYLPEVAFSLKVIGDLFLATLKMLIVPLIFASIFVAIAGLGSVNELKNLGAKALIYYFVTTSLAVGLGVIVVNIIDAGSDSSLVMSQFGDKVGEAVHIKEFSIDQFILSFVPTNLFQSLTNGSIIQIIFFVVLFSVATLYIEEEKKQTLFNFFDSLNETMMVVAKWIIKLTPIGVFSLVAFVIAEKGIDVLFSLWEYVISVLLALFLHAFATLPFLFFLVTKENPYLYFLKVREAVLLAFSTASSSATLPISIEISQEKGDVSKKVSGFVLPLGATVNMDGTALYESIAVLFIANLAGVDLSLSQQILIFVTATLASIGAAGIPGAGIVMMVVVLDSVGLPHEYIPVILVVDRILDMFRTATNVWGDLLGTKLLNHIYLKNHK